MQNPSFKEPLPVYSVNRDRWNQLTILEQMGNIGSEVGRTLKLKRKGASYEAALIRALDLFDATVEHLLQTNPYRIKEVLRSKDQFLQSVLIKDDPSIEKYFMQFAIPARRKVG